MQAILTKSRSCLPVSVLFLPSCFTTTTQIFPENRSFAPMVRVFSVPRSSFAFCVWIVAFSWFSSYVYLTYHDNNLKKIIFLIIAHSLSNQLKHVPQSFIRSSNLPLELFARYIFLSTIIWFMAKNQFPISVHVPSKIVSLSTEKWFLQRWNWMFIDLSLQWQMRYFPPHWGRTAPSGYRILTEWSIASASDGKRPQIYCTTFYVNIWVRTMYALAFIGMIVSKEDFLHRIWEHIMKNIFWRKLHE